MRSRYPYHPVGALAHEPGVLTSGFGQRRDPTWKGDPPAPLVGHNGQDYGVPVGTPLLACADGVVAWVSLNPVQLSGTNIGIRHGDGRVVSYSHLSSVKVTKGQTVKAGDVVALSGNTGQYVTGPKTGQPSTTGPHCHVVVMDADGHSIDPLTVFPVIGKATLAHAADALVTSCDCDHGAHGLDGPPEEDEAGQCLVDGQSVGGYTPIRRS